MSVLSDTKTRYAAGVRTRVINGASYDNPPPANTEQYNRADNLIASRSSGQVAGGEWRARRWRLVKRERNQMSPAPACISIPSVAGQRAARGPVSIITTHLVEHLECYYEVELQTKVHSKVRNHGEGLLLPGPSPG